MGRGGPLDNRRAIERTVRTAQAIRMIIADRRRRLSTSITYVDYLFRPQDRMAVLPVGRQLHEYSIAASVDETLEPRAGSSVPRTDRSRCRPTVSGFLRCRRRRRTARP